MLQAFLDILDKQTYCIYFQYLVARTSYYLTHQKGYTKYKSEKIPVTVTQIF